MLLPPSIFNDVLGPVMRGPSSSHSAASVRIGRLARELAGKCFDHVLVEFDTNGSLATTHLTQGSDMGLWGGLLGWQADDPRLPESDQAIRKAGIATEIKIHHFGATHPNTYRLTLSKGTTRHQLVADSLGGGMIQVTQIDGQPVQLHGDYRVSLLAGLTSEAVERLRCEIPDAVSITHGPRWTVLVGVDFVSSQLARQIGASQLRCLESVLPVPSLPEMQLPFTSSQAMLESEASAQKLLSEYALQYETARSGKQKTDILEMMKSISEVMRHSIEYGLKGTESENRILGNQSRGYRQAMQSNRLLQGDLLNQMVLYISAIMEAKSAMEVIVAAPTAGSCGTFAGVCLAAGEILKIEPEKQLRAMLAGGLIGVFVATQSSFAAEVGGCQAETGAGSAMAAAALVEMQGGNAQTALAAASMALQNVLGLVCDPVANRVEAPCLGRNISGASNAFVSANMALAGYDPVIPFDEVLETHRQISQSMPRELRCTALGGLSITPTSLRIENELKVIPS